MGVAHECAALYRHNGNVTFARFRPIAAEGVEEDVGVLLGADDIARSRQITGCPIGTRRLSLLPVRSAATNFSPRT